MIIVMVMMVVSQADLVMRAATHSTGLVVAILTPQASEAKETKEAKEGLGRGLRPGTRDVRPSQVTTAMASSLQGTKINTSV